MSIQQLNNLNLKAGLEADGDVGSAGQVLSSTGPNGIEWINQSTLSSGSAERTEILVKNLEGSALSKGDPVYIIGSVGASERLEVGLANAGDAAKMPCVGLLTQDLAINGEGTAIVTGKLKNLITSPIDGATPTENDTIYVKSGGGLTLTKPTGATNLIQNVGQVGRVSTSSDGNIVVSAILRSNDVPNLPTGRIWVGDGNTTVSGVVYLDEANGRMGIGTSSPRVPLQVSSNEIDTDFLIECGNTQSRMSINNTSTGDSQINFQLSNSSKFAIGVDNSDSDKFKISGSSVLGSNDRFVIDSSGNVGIGTTNPEAILHINGTEDTTYWGPLIKSTSTNPARLTFTNTEGSGFIDQNDNALRFYHNGGYRMYINSSGNVGIGTTSPSGRLTIGSGVATDNSTMFNVNGQYNDVGFNGGTSGLLTQGVWSFINSGTWDQTRFYVQDQNNSNSRLTFDFKGNGGNINILAGTSSGNVGIGTTSPGEKLSIQPGADVSAEIGRAHIGNIGFTTYAGFSHIDRNSQGNYALLQETSGQTFLNASATQNIRFRINNTDQMILTGGGYFGIGTTSPSYKLDVNGTIASSVSSGFPELRLSDAVSDFVISTNSGGEGVIKTEGPSKNIRFFNDSGETMRISGGGNVGIGTTSPDTKLHIVDNDCYITLEDNNSASPTYYDSGIIFRENRCKIRYTNNPGFQGLIAAAGSSAYTSRLYLKESNGYLGIGTSPSYQLQLSLNSAAKPSSIYWTTTSDERVKTNIRQYEKSLEHVVQLNPKLYDYNGKAGFDPNSVDNIGFIAQDIVDIFPEAVKTYKAKLEETDEKETELYNIDFQAITFAMINSIKELNNKIEQLETRIQTLENN